MSCPVVIRGVHYNSQKEAAEKLGIKAGAVLRALNRGVLDEVGLGKPINHRVSVSINGGDFESIKSAIAKKPWLKSSTIYYKISFNRDLGLRNFIYLGMKFKFKYAGEK